MVSFADEIARGRDANGRIKAAYRRLQFFVAVTIIHEVGQIFLNYLNGNQRPTPPTMAADASCGGCKVEGEAGLILISTIFGGPVAWYCDPTEKVSSYGVCADTFALIQGQLLSPQAYMRYRP